MTQKFPLPCLDVFRVNRLLSQGQIALCILNISPPRLTITIVSYEILITMSMAQDAMRKNRPKPPTRRYPKIEDSVVVAGITPHVRRFSSPHRLPTHRGAWARFWKGENPGLQRRLWLTFANLGMFRIPQRAANVGH